MNNQRLRWFAVANYLMPDGTESERRSIECFDSKMAAEAWARRDKSVRSRPNSHLPVPRFYRYETKTVRADWNDRACRAM